MPGAVKNKQATRTQTTTTSSSSAPSGCAVATSSSQSASVVTARVTVSTNLVLHWSCEDVGQWLVSSGFAQYATLFRDVHRIDGATLMLMHESDLRQPPLQLSCLSDVKKLGRMIQELQQDEVHTKHVTNGHVEMCSTPKRDVRFNIGDCSDVGCASNNVSSEPHHRKSNNTNLNSPDQVTIPTAMLSNPELVHVLSDVSKRTPGLHLSPSLSARLTAFNAEEFCRQVESPDTPRKELFKAVLAFVYCSLALFFTSFVMVLVHDSGSRVPDMKTYPPLPDIVLDNIPLIPWAFEVCEMLACVMAFIWMMILLFHKRRLIVIRRSFSLCGTVFLLRCITMLITSLSVPGVHLECRAKSYGNLWAKLRQAFRIWSGLGMSLQGVRTCGDYIFSGHTTAVTLLNHFITEYTPENWTGLHTATWVMNLFAIFFILAAHEHYSIDVFIAFYISSRLFLYYHAMAHMRLGRDKRTRAWFPFMWFFESGSPEIVPNEFEWPLPSYESIQKWFTDWRNKKTNDVAPTPIAETPTGSGSKTKSVNYNNNHVGSFPKQRKSNKKKDS